MPCLINLFDRLPTNTPQTGRWKYLSFPTIPLSYLTASGACITPTVMPGFTQIVQNQYLSNFGENCLFVDFPTSSYIPQGNYDFNYEIGTGNCISEFKVTVKIINQPNIIQPVDLNICANYPNIDLSNIFGSTPSNYQDEIKVYDSNNNLVGSNIFNINTFIPSGVTIYPSEYTVKIEREPTVSYDNCNICFFTKEFKITVYEYLNSTIENNIIVRCV